MYLFDEKTGTFVKYGNAHTPTFKEFLKGLEVVDLQDRGVCMNFQALYVRLRRYSSQPRAVRAAVLGTLWLYYGHSRYRTERVLSQYLTDNSFFVKADVYAALWEYARG